MKDILNNILKLLGIVIALLVIMTIFVLVLRTATPVKSSPQVTKKPQQQSWLYNPLWDWYYYPYYWFYPREKHHHYYDDKKPNNPPAPAPTTAPAPAPTTAPAPAPTTAPAPAPTTAPAPAPTTAPAPAPTSGSLPLQPSSGSTSVPDILPEITISNSLSSGISVPVQPIQPIEPSDQLIQQLPSIPIPSPEANIVQSFDNITESFSDFNGAVPEPWSKIDSSPEVLPESS